MIANFQAFFATVSSLPLLLLLYSLYSKRTRKYPPVLNESLFSIVAKLQAGMPIIWTYKKAYEQLGPIFRIRMPELGWHYVVAEPKLAKLILEGDKTCKGADKNNYYKSFDSISFGYSSVFTKFTHGDGWDWARKGIAPGFSQMNFQKNIEKYCSVLKRAANILDDHIFNKLPFDR